MSAELHPSHENVSARTLTSSNKASTNEIRRRQRHPPDHDRQQLEGP
ncbi:hypothetical protein [Nocardia farcinica]|nr:hypothetical protein [Nocardia farcinica]